ILHDPRVELAVEQRRQVRGTGGDRLGDLLPLGGGELADTDRDVVELAGAAHDPGRDVAGVHLELAHRALPGVGTTPRQAALVAGSGALERGDPRPSPPGRAEVAPGHQT